MGPSVNSHRPTQICLLTATMLCLMSNGEASIGDDVLPDIDALAEKTAGSMGLRADDLISRSHVSTILNLLAADDVVIQPDAARKVRDRVLADGDFLVRNLRTGSGTAFMRRIAKYQFGYDRLDRLIRMPHGRYRLHELIRGPDGHLLIAYLTKTQGGKNMGRLLSHAATGRRFNRPTGRFYTIKDVVRFICGPSSELGAALMERRPGGTEPSNLTKATVCQP